MYKSGLARPLNKPKVSPSSSPSLLGRLARLSFTLYLLTAISYTSWHFLLQPVASLIIYGSAAGIQPPAMTADQLAYVPPVLDSKADLDAKIERALHINEDKGDKLWGRDKKKKGGGAAAHRDQAARIAAAAEAAGGEGGSKALQSSVKSHYAVSGEEWSRDLMQWYPQSDSRSHPRGRHANSALRSAPDIHRKATPMLEDFFLSKAFGESLQPTKVVPYYYKASADFAQEDITITTLVTSNRLKVLANLVEHYQGGFGRHLIWPRFLNRIAQVLSRSPFTSPTIHRPRTNSSTRCMPSTPRSPPCLPGSTSILSSTTLIDNSTCGGTSPNSSPGPTTL